MKYDIQLKQELSGSVATVMFPEENIDLKAFCTIQSDLPVFLVPFHHRIIDGNIEMTYDLKNLTKLRFLSGKKRADEYISFWENLLFPLFECEDWFAKPFSFAIGIDYVYFDKNTKMVNYLYIPTKDDCSTSQELQQLIREFSQINSVDDPSLENQVLKAVMHEIHPRDFLQMIQNVRKNRMIPESNHQSIPTRKEIDSPVSTNAKFEKHIPPKGVNQVKPIPTLEPVSEKKEVPLSFGEDDIQIDFENLDIVEKKEKKGLFGGKRKKEEKLKKEKSKKEKQKKGIIFKGKKEKADKEFIFGADMESILPIEKDNREQIPAWSGKEAHHTPPTEWHEEVHKPVMVDDQQIYEESLDSDDSETQMDEGKYASSYLRLIGDPSLPNLIPIDISVGQVFTIGRFDISVGHKQSDFEFDKRTKTVSRRHAAIERKDEWYEIVDLNSKGGTFLDGNRLSSTSAYRLKNGSRVSFGTAGAEYIWEEN